MHTRRTRPQRATMGRNRDSRRPFHEADLSTTLKEPHLMQDVVEIDKFIRRMTALPSRIQRVHPGQEALIELAEYPHRVIDALAALQQTRQNLVDVTDRKSVICTVLRDQPLGAFPVTIPQFSVSIFFTTEHQELTLRAAWNQNRNGIRFLETRDVEKIAVGTIRIERIAAAGALRRGR